MIEIVPDFTYRNPRKYGSTLCVYIYIYICLYTYILGPAGFVSFQRLVLVSLRVVKSVPEASWHVGGLTHHGPTISSSCSNRHSKYLSFKRQSGNFKLSWHPNLVLSKRLNLSFLGGWRTEIGSLWLALQAPAAQQPWGSVK